MTTPLEPFDLPQPLPQYFINESGLRVNVQTGDLIPPENTENKNPYERINNYVKR